MSSDNKSTYNCSISFFSLITIVFITLKLGIGNTSVMGWSWWWVLSPLWIPGALLLSIVAIFFVIWLIIRIFK